MTRKPFAALFLLVWTAVALTAVAPSRQKDPSAKVPGKASHLERGLAGFEQGLYTFLPTGRAAEADAAFVAAIRELELVLEIEPNNRQAHRILARIHSIRKDYAAAAGHFRRLTEIDPFDLDAYVLAALYLAEAGSFLEARVELERAKGRTADPHALALLDGYLARLAEAERTVSAASGSRAKAGR
jgi:tetratricopeptide (TPR) repeat protein